MLQGLKYAEVAQLARAPAFQAGCREFESRLPLQNLAPLLWKSSELACDPQLMWIGTRLPMKTFAWCRK